jgi:hypothetical protein
MALFRDYLGTYNKCCQCQWSHILAFSCHAYILELHLTIPVVHSSSELARGRADNLLPLFDTLLALE